MIGDISLFLLLVLFPLFVESSTCNDQIRLNGRQQKSSIYCSTCSTYFEEQKLIPVIQLEMSSLTQLTGIFLQIYDGNQEDNFKTGSYFIEYRRTQDGPWRSYGQRRQRKLFIERRRLYFNNSNETRTFLPMIIARQIRIIFPTISLSTCAIIQIFGCQSQNGLISTRYPQRSIVNTDLKYDGIITNSTARGGLGILTDGNTNEFIQWSSISKPILLLFAFESIKQFESINLDLKCLAISSSSCTLKINIGILETISTKNLWTNNFRSIIIEKNSDNRTITHLILSLSNTKGQFVIIQMNTNQDLAISEITFNNKNQYNDEDYNIIPSSIYIEATLHRLELLALGYLSDDLSIYEKFLNILIFVLITCALIIMFLLISCMFTHKRIQVIQTTSEEIEQSITTSVTTSSIHENPYQIDPCSDVESDDDDELTSVSCEPINSLRIVNESSKATIRLLNSHRQTVTPRCSIPNIHNINTHLSRIDSNEIIIIQNLGAENNHECFYSEYGENRLPVILCEQEKNEFFNLSKLIDHENIVSCFGYINVTPQRTLLVCEYSRINLYEYCQTLEIDKQDTLIILMGFLNEIILGLIHLESLNLIIHDVTLPNCLLFNNNKTIKLSDYAKQDDRYASRYVQQIPIRWLPGDIVTKDENWSIHTNTFMFGTLLFELFHLGLYIPYNEFDDNQVLEFYRNYWINSKENSVEPSVLCYTKHFPRPILSNDRLYGLIERCLSWSSLDRPSFKEIHLCLDETTTTVLSQ